MKFLARRRSSSDQGWDLTWVSNAMTNGTLQLQI